MKTIVCNWKLNPQTVTDAKRLFDETKKIAQKYKKAQIVVIPPTIFLAQIRGKYTGTRIEFGVQALSTKQSGSFTGGVSAFQVRDVRATYALVGHAEQRANGVTNEDTYEKVQASLEAKLDVILAVGERERDEEGAYIAYIREQLTQALKNVPVGRFKNITIAYEPVWAIGADEAPSAEDVHKMILLIKKIIADNYGQRALSHIRVLYGGSVNDENAEEILSIPGLHGVLVGRVSLQPKKLEALIAVASEIKE